MAEHMQYTIDSKVMGFPVLKYPIIVTPSWLNIGFIIAVTISKGIIYNILNFTAPFPFNITEYINEDIKDIIRNIGCIKNILNIMTEKK